MTVYTCTHLPISIDVCMESKTKWFSRIVIVNASFFSTLTSMQGLGR